MDRQLSWLELWRSIGYNTAIMNKGLTHLPADKQQQLELIKDIILAKVPDVRMVVLFGSYARGGKLLLIFTR